jgi:hypothetical protein
MAMGLKKEGPNGFQEVASTKVPILDRAYEPLRVGFGKRGTSQTKNGTSNDRLFYALPNFLMLENGANLLPLTAKQTFAISIAVRSRRVR